MICDDKYKYIEYGETIRRKFKGGIEIVIKLKDDEIGFTSDFLGEFSRSYQPGAIVSEHDSHDGEGRFYVPEHFQADWKFNRATGKDNPRKTGYSRHEAYTLARKYAIAERDLREEYLRGDWGQYGLVVSVYLDGKLVGQDSIWGIDLGNYADKNQDYLNEIASDVVYEALHDAHGTVAGRLDIAYGVENPFDRLIAAYKRLFSQQRKIEKRRAYVEKITAWRKDRPKYHGNGFAHLNLTAVLNRY